MIKGCGLPENAAHVGVIGSRKENGNGDFGGGQFVYVNGLLVGLVTFGLIGILCDPKQYFRGFWDYMLMEHQRTEGTGGTRKKGLVPQTAGKRKSPRVNFCAPCH